MNHRVRMLIKMVMNCLVDDYPGLRACSILVAVHGVDLRLLCANVWCAGIEESTRCVFWVFANWDARCMLEGYMCKKAHF